MRTIKDIPTLVEYRVRPVTRFVVTRYHEGDTEEGGITTKNCFAGSDICGEFASIAQADHVATALFERDKAALGDIVRYTAPPKSE